MKRKAIDKLWYGCKIPKTQRGLIQYFQAQVEIGIFRARTRRSFNSYYYSYSSSVYLPSPLNRAKGPFPTITEAKKAATLKLKPFMDIIATLEYDLSVGTGYVEIVRAKAGDYVAMVMVGEQLIFETSPDSVLLNVVFAAMEYLDATYTIINRLP